jgi:hypothetical protein
MKLHRRIVFKAPLEQSVLALGTEKYHHIDPELLQKKVFQNILTVSHHFPPMGLME